ncbi:hypothetical protein AMS68_000011 [Peltaster fructicola]|uniref:RING-type domain-containing protein n=1 Tax=Peltaster fructicola TaxID=286661 RepID=A0A6H0XIF6_9PEZI|nr:hypothetical protein AMS68_000011 [Peltaster fructicola]
MASDWDFDLGELLGSELIDEEFYPDAHLGATLRTEGHEAFLAELLATTQADNLAADRRRTRLTSPRPASSMSAADMSRQRRNARHTTEVVDLTAEAPAAITAHSATSTQRRPSTTIVPHGRKRKREEEPEKQQSVIEEPTPPQWQEPGEGQTKIGQMTCIICMEAFTNASMGQCGHIFCHECLTRALMASERHQDRGAGTCPTCRKPIYRKKKDQIIKLNFMKKSTFKQRT